MFGKKLRTDEKEYKSTIKDSRQWAITKWFKEEFSELLENDWKKTLFQAQKLYDITFWLTPNQVQGIKGVKMWEILDIPLTLAHIPQNMCQKTSG